MAIICARAEEEVYLRCPCVIALMLDQGISGTEVCRLEMQKASKSRPFHILHSLGHNCSEARSTPYVTEPHRAHITRFR